MKIVKALIAPLSMLFVLATSPVVNASENPFGMSAQSADQMQVAENQEGKCGGSMKQEGKCGDSMKNDAKKDGKCGTGKCGEGKCGDAMKKGAKDGKCGEGKCGGSMKKEAMPAGKCGGN